MDSCNMDEVDNVFAVNTLSQFSVIQSFLPDLMDQKVSNIVNMSSLIALIPASHLSPYSASKAAVKAMSDCLRIELKSTNRDYIHVTTILPQFIGTGMFRGALSYKYQSGGEFMVVVSDTP